MNLSEKDWKISSEKEMHSHFFFTHNSSGLHPVAPDVQEHPALQLFLQNNFHGLRERRFAKSPGSLLFIKDEENRAFHKIIRYCKNHHI